MSDNLSTIIEVFRDNTSFFPLVRNITTFSRDLNNYLNKRKKAFSMKNELLSRVWKTVARNHIYPKAPEDKWSFKLLVFNDITVKKIPMLSDLNKTIDLVRKLQTTYVTPALLIIFRCLARTQLMTIVFMIKICIKNNLWSNFLLSIFFLNINTGR